MARKHVAEALVAVLIVLCACFIVVVVWHGRMIGRVMDENSDALRANMGAIHDATTQSRYATEQSERNFELLQKIRQTQRQESEP